MNNELSETECKGKKQPVGVKVSITVAFIVMGLFFWIRVFAGGTVALNLIFRGGLSAIVIAVLDSLVLLMCIVMLLTQSSKLVSVLKWLGVILAICFLGTVVFEDSFSKYQELVQNSAESEYILAENIWTHLSEASQSERGGYIQEKHFLPNATLYRTEQNLGPANSYFISYRIVAPKLLINRAEEELHTYLADKFGASYQHLGEKVVIGTLNSTKKEYQFVTINKGDELIIIMFEENDRCSMEAVIDYIGE
ncbi:hypothetical protein SAMN02910339_02290 [Lachnospiraceae bacterium YSD2013]|nr:hypothetical protein SAMN02910339_02290 [Lachnospiraceae bacterium YSD2013]